MRPSPACDLLGHAGSGGGGDGEHGRVAQLGERLGDEEVVGAEIVAPHADAVGLVDDDPGDAGRPQGAEEGVVAQPLGRDVDELEVAPRQIVEAGAHLVAGEGAVDQRGARADGGRERLDLVLHQGDQRRDDDGRALVEQRRELEGQRLAGAGRHDRQRVLAAQRAGDDGGLPGAQILVAELCAEGVENPRFDGGIGHRGDGREDGRGRRPRPRPPDGGRGVSHGRCGRGRHAAGALGGSGDLVAQGAGAGDVEEGGARGELARATEVADGGGNAAGRLELVGGGAFAGRGQRPAKEGGGGVAVVFVDGDLGQGEQRGRVLLAGVDEAQVVGAGGFAVAGGAGDVGGELGDGDEVGVGHREALADLRGFVGEAALQMEAGDRDLGGRRGRPLRPLREDGEGGGVIAAGEGEARPLLEQPDLLAVACGHAVEEGLGVVEAAAGAGDADDGPDQLGGQPVGRGKGEGDRLVGQLLVAPPVRVRSAFVVHGSTQVR